MNTYYPHFRIAFLSLACCFPALQTTAQEPSATVIKLIDQHCAGCHNANTKEGNLDLQTLVKQPVSQNALEIWVKIHDRVQAGEMPPPEQPKIGDSESNSFLIAIGKAIIEAERQMLVDSGRAINRRLNRYEYENSIRDLLSLPYLEIRQSLPEDPISHGFNKSGEALDVSHVQLSRYLRTAENALREAIIRQTGLPKPIRQRFYSWDQLKFTRGNGPNIRKTYPVLGYEIQTALNVRPAEKSGSFIRPLPGRHSIPSRRDEEAVVMVSSTYEHVEIQYDQFRAPSSGRYRLKFAGYTVWMSADYTELTSGRRTEPITVYADSPPRKLRRLGHFDFHPKTSVQELEVWLKAGETIRPDASRLVRSRPPQFQNPLLEEDGMPGVAYQWLEVEGPIHEDWPPPGHQLLFGSLKTTESNSEEYQKFIAEDYPNYERGTSSTEPNPLDILDGIYNAHNRPPARGHVSVESTEPIDDAERLLRNFMTQAHRRPVSDNDLQRFLTLIHESLANGHTFTESMLAGYTAVLGSPEFLYHQARPGVLDAHALAERLSFFLWNSPPDETLRSLAVSGLLLNSDILSQQVDRMLDDPKSRRFVNAFLDYWLDLRNMTASDPDSELYPEYQLDDALVESMSEETQLYFQELIRGDLSIRHVVDSDFIIINERLATLYEIEDVLGAGFRPVELDDSSPRGGLMTQASVLKVTANGTTSSPVTRGAWVMERLLGIHVPPPPPSVQAIESDIRGASTIREQLALHRSHQSCNVCHSQIDPAGFALENFDVMGAWRDQYRTTSEGNGVLVSGIGHNGFINRYRLGPSVNASGTLPDGQGFKDILDLKQILLTKEHLLARNMVNQLMVFATGAPNRFSDREQLEAIIENSKPRHYGVRTLIREVVKSSLFLNK